MWELAHTVDRVCAYRYADFQLHWPWLKSVMGNEQPNACSTLLQDSCLHLAHTIRMRSSVLQESAELSRITVSKCMDGDVTIWSTLIPIQHKLDIFS